MACDGYTNSALMGNWYEDREAVDQPYKQNVSFRNKREVEETISHFSQTNQLMPLRRIERVHPWNTSSIICDDGFKEYKTMNKTLYDPTYIRNYKGYTDCRPIVKTIEPRKAYPENQTMIITNHARAFSLLNHQNMKKHATETQRDVKMNMTDFGSTFKTHVPDHERFFMMTTYQEHFDRQGKPTAEEVIEKDGKRLASFRGGNTKPENQKGIKMTSPLVGEVLKNERDPQQNTRVQRSWLPYVENAIQVAEDNIGKNTEINSSTGFKSLNKLDNYKNNNTQVLPFDIATSLAMGDGVHTLKSKYMEPGAFRKIRTDATIIKNKPITKK